MKVLIFNTLYYPNMLGGAEKSLQIFAEGLSARGIETVIVSSSRKDEIFYVNGIKVYYVKVPNLYWILDNKKPKPVERIFKNLLDIYNILIFKKLRKIIKSEKPNLVHTNNLGPFTAFLWRIAKFYHLPIIHTIRDLSLLCPKVSMFKKGELCINQCLFCRLVTIPKRIESQKINAVVGSSKYILDKHLSAGYFKYSKVKTQIFNPSGKVKMVAQNKIYKKKKDVNLGVVASVLSPNKGIDFVINEFNKLNVPDTNLLIYGKILDEKYHRSINSLCNENPRIKLMGFHPAEKIYSNLDILIIPSLTPEAFPRTLIEAYSNGVPVLASDRGGTSEMVENKACGYLYNPEDPTEFRRLLILMIQDKELLKKMSARVKVVAQEFSLEKILNKYIDIYYQIN